MGGAQAAKTILQIQLASLKASGKEADEEAAQQLYDKIKQRYDDQTTATYAASRLWVDAIIDPLETRKIISMGIEMANHAPVERFNPGVIQT